MGCCLSKHNPQTQTQTSLKTQQQPQLKSNPTHEVAPPPPFEDEEEEESVKEVLSETPISKPHQVPILTKETKTQMPLLQNPVEVFETKDLNPIISEPNQVSILKPETKTQMPLLQNPAEVFETEKEVTELVSHPSEACSISESFSTTTTATATTEKREEDEATSERRSRERTTTMNHKWNRSPSNASSRKGPYAVNGNGAGGKGGRPKSQAKRSEPSPEKKIQSGPRSVRGRESGPVANRKVNAGFRRDSGEGSGRRSRSPSCSRTAGGMNRVCGDGGGKEAPPVNGVAEKEEKRESESEEVGKENDVVTQEESIENPHVSMECFIFL
ncbi:hypothetical protein RIF29_31461 [Crotalaria pallida]|uniref:Uncharacterized protein n=1 Tax=Crotalaria pallida TaxID=3830 RepID=A0AAN9EMH3_CROPI